MARRNQMSDQEAMGLIAKMFIIWPLQIIEGWTKRNIYFRMFYIG